MTLAEAVAALARRPGSVRARAAVAAQLEVLGVPAATGVWAAAVSVAAARGQFFIALTLCLRRLRGALRKQKLGELAARYGAGRARTTRKRRPPPVVRPRSIRVPNEEKAVAKVAIELGIDLKGVIQPDDAPVHDVPVFSTLPKEAFVSLCDSLREVVLTPGHTFIHQGEIERTVYFLALGRAVVVRKTADGKEHRLATSEAPAVVGEMAFLTDVPRRATVRADTPGLAWRIDGDALNRLGYQHPTVLGELAGFVKNRLLLNVMRSSRLLGGVSAPAPFLQGFQLGVFEPGTEVFPQGAAPPGLFVLLHGEAEVWASGDDDAPVRVAVLTEGDMFGEMSLLTSDPTTAAVYMHDGGVVLHLPVDGYRAVRGFVPQLEQELSALAHVRRGELDELVHPVEYSFEDVGEEWLLEERETFSPDDDPLDW